MSQFKETRDIFGLRVWGTRMESNLYTEKQVLAPKSRTARNFTYAILHLQSALAYNLNL